MNEHRCLKRGKMFTEEVTKHDESPGASVGSHDDVPWLCLECNEKAVGRCP